MSFAQFYLENIVYRSKDNDPLLQSLKQIRKQKLEEAKNKKKKTKKK